MYQLFTLVILCFLSFSCFAQINPIPIADYPFNASAEDISGNGYHGTVNGAVLSEDRFGNSNSAYYFDGIDDYIKVTSHLPNLPSGTINFWFAPENNWDSNSNYEVLIETDSVGDTEGDFLIAFNRTNCFSTAASYDGKIYFELQGDFINANDSECPGYGLVSVSTENNVWEAQDWYMITAVVCEEEETMKIYQNGELINSYSTVSSLFRGDKPFYIGKFGTNPVQDASQFNGVIDDILIFSDCLESEDIRELYNEENPLSAKETFQVFPSFTYNNPVQNILSIKFDHVVPSIKLACYSATGQQMIAISADNRSVFEINTNDWIAGIYIIKMELGDNSHQFKFIKL
jgi:Concanavalin A-like lectin/glucanases superfamily